MGDININGLLQGQTVDFRSLCDVANGKYNMGEVDAKDGRHGIVFGKINNHVTNTGKNTVTRSADQNNRTNAAVFKAILEHYGAIDGDEVVHELAGRDISCKNGEDTAIDNLFSRFSNPYIKEAFKFLMLGDAKGRPLSRDELKLLLNLLDKGADAVANNGQTDSASAAKTGKDGNQPLADSVRMQNDRALSEARMRLKNLHEFKATGELLLNDQYKQTLADIKGLKVAPRGGSKRAALLKTTQNQQQFNQTQPRIVLDETKFEKMILGSVPNPVSQEGVGGSSMQPKVGTAGNAAITPEDKDLVDEIAANAYGSREGAEGGEGYMGVFDGKVTKCLTHSSERRNLGKGLTDDQVKVVNDATDVLRMQLLTLANKYAAGPVKDEIARLLAKNESVAAERNGLDLLARKVVAQVVTLLSKDAPALFSWKGLEAADTVKNTSLSAIFARGKLSDEKIQELKSNTLRRLYGAAEDIDQRIGKPDENTLRPVKGSGVRKFRAFIDLLTNPKLVDDAFNEVERELKKPGCPPLISLCHNADVTTMHPVANMGKQFRRSHEDTKTEGTCVEVISDGVDFGRGFGEGSCDDEARVIVESLDPKVAAWMLKKGMIKLADCNGTLGFKYVNQTLADGGYILSDPFSGRRLAFHTLPSLDVRTLGNNSIVANADWACQAAQDAGLAVTPQKRANACKFVQKFYEEVRSTELYKSAQEYEGDQEKLQVMMEYLLYSQDYEHCDLFAHRRDNEVAKAAKAFVAFAVDQFKTESGFESFRKKARAGYEATVGKSMAKMFHAAQNLGVAHFVSDWKNVGFDLGNNLYTVAKVMSTGFKQQGGGMNYVCDVGDPFVESLFTKE